MSMAFFQENEEEAIIWRGPMIHNAINQFLTMTEWGDLDYMVVDLPPGTSDAPLTVMQTLNIDGFVVVTSPQELAALDAKRSINMIRKLNLPVIGIVENFSGPIFGSGAGEELAEEMGLPFLGRTAMREEYRDAHRPAVFESEAIADEYQHIASELRRRISLLDESN
jgi:ATP-binding protein involved in chromosome partitioning